MPPGNPFLNRLAAKGLNSHGKRSEQKVARKLGARLQPNSGAMRGAKSDAKLGQFRLEMKSTTGDTLKLDIGWLAKIAQEALQAGQQPAIVVSFVDQQGTARLKQFAEWVLVPMPVFQELTEV